MQAPRDIQWIGDRLAIIWPDGREFYLPAEYLRACSPSAENIGEKDILGNQYGGDGPKSFPGVTITRWDYVGRYAIRPVFSDGHQTGIYAWPYLMRLCEAYREAV